MNKASDGLIPQIDQIENKKKMIEKLQQEINKENKAQELYKSSANKLNRRKEKILKSTESLSDYLLTSLREKDQYHQDHKFKEAIDSISQYMGKSKFQSKHFQHLKPIDKKKVQIEDDKEKEE